MKIFTKWISTILFSFIVIFLFGACSNGAEDNKKETEPRIYSVIFNPNGGNIITVSQDIKENKPTLLMKAETIGLSYNGKKFIGWGLTSKDTVPAYLDGAEIKLNKNITLYALWENIETIKISCQNTIITTEEQIELAISFENFIIKPTYIDVYVENNLNPIAEKVSIVNNKLSISPNDWESGSYKIFIKTGNIESNHITIKINEKQIELPKRITITSEYSYVEKGDYIEFSIVFNNFQIKPTNIDIYREGQEKAIATRVAISNGKILFTTDNLEAKNYQLYVKSDNIESNSISIEIKDKIKDEIKEKKIVLTKNESYISIGDDLSLSVDFENFTLNPTSLDVYIVGNDIPLATGITVADGKLSVPTTSLTAGNVSLYVKSKTTTSNIISLTAKEKSIRISSTKTTLYTYETLTFSIEFNNYLSEPTSTSIYIEDKLDAIATDILDGKISVSASELDAGEHSIYLKNGNIESNRISVKIIGKTINISTAASTIINNNFELTVTFDGFKENPTTIDLLNNENDTTNLSISNGKILISTENWDIGAHSIYVKDANTSSNTITVTNAARLNNDGSYTVTVDTFETTLNMIESSKATIKIQDSLTSILKVSEIVRNSLVLIDLDLSEISDLKIIRNSDFHDCTRLASIILPNCLTKIAQSAFSGCTNLANITISENVTTIEDHAFSDCTRLTNIIVPSSVKYIGENAFYNCLGLKSITLPFVGADINRSSSSTQNKFGYIFGASSETGYIKVLDYNNTYYYIPASLKDVTITGGKLIDREFRNCTGLRTINLTGVKQIGSQVFENCSNLTSISLSNSITSIGSYAFAECTNLTSINLPTSITSIGAYAFQNCKNLKNLVIPDSVTEVSEGAFQDCGIINISLSNNLLTIQEYTFKDCSKLKEISIPESIISIGSYAFKGCSSLTNIIVPDSVTSIGKYAFADCSSVQEITVPFIGQDINSDSPFASIFGESSDTFNIEISYKRNEQTINYYIPKSLKTVKITNNEVHNIKDHAFYGCRNLTNIILPDNITSIEDYAFSLCINLTNITLPENITSIGKDAFNNCKNLTNISLPDNITSIGEESFKDCTNLKNITLGNNVTSIGYQAFSGCSNLTSITLPDNITSIGNSAFSYCSNLTSITLPKNLLIINSSTIFLACESLSTVYFPIPSCWQIYKYEKANNNYDYYWKKDIQYSVTDTTNPSESANYLNGSQGVYKLERIN